VAELLGLDDGVAFRTIRILDVVHCVVFHGLYHTNTNICRCLRGPWMGQRVKISQ
jgi:hypothetical protein